MGIHQRLPALPPDCLRLWTEDERRYPVTASTVLRTADGRSASANVLSLSNKDCMIRTEFALRLGERVSFLLEPLGLVDGEVRCINGNDLQLELVARDPFYSGYQLAYAP